jgi:hypothetical protein
MNFLNFLQILDKMNANNKTLIIFIFSIFLKILAINTDLYI